jgi:hypothetical protein
MKYLTQLHYTSVSIFNLSVIRFIFIHLYPVIILEIVQNFIIIIFIFLPSDYREGYVKGDWYTWHLWREISILGTCPEFLTH